MMQRLRKLRKLTQAALASRAGVCESTIYRLEAGSRVPSMATAEALARALDVPAGVLSGPGWLGLIEVMGATLEPKGKRWIASAGELEGTGGTAEEAVMSLFEEWSAEQ